VIGRIVIVPIFALSIAFSLSGIIDFSYGWAAIIALFASPVAVASVSVTKGFDGDDELASQIVIWTTALAIITLFIIVVLFRFYGLL
jgi:predicted permease